MSIYDEQLKDVPCRCHPQACTCRKKEEKVEEGRGITVEAVAERKRAMEETIRQMLLDFQHETGANVTKLNLVTYSGENIGGKKYVNIYEVEVEVQII